MIMSKLLWKTFPLELPEQPGIYDVRVQDTLSRLSPSVEMLVEWNGRDWKFMDAMFKNSYKVFAWRERM